MRNVLCLVSCILCLVSCSQNQNKIPVVGEIDSVAIAQDTTMQLGIESSYEYHKTLVVNEKLVYDVVGYGGPASSGEFAILRRGADNKADTLVKGHREGIIRDILMGDLNGNKQKEIYVITQSANYQGNVLAFEISTAGHCSLIKFKKETHENSLSEQDTVYLDKNMLVRSVYHFSLESKPEPYMHSVLRYKLENGELRIAQRNDSYI